MPMSILAILIVGDLLILAGLIAFFLTGASHFTALIPAAAGLLLQLITIAGFFLPTWRRTFLAITAVLALLGVAVALSRPTMKILSGSSLQWNAATISQLVMAIGCAAIFCIGAAAALTPPRE